MINPGVVAAILYNKIQYITVLLLQHRD